MREVKTCDTCLHSCSITRCTIEEQNTCFQCREVKPGVWSKWAKNTGIMQFEVQCQDCGAVLPKLIGSRCRKCGSEHTVVMPERVTTTSLPLALG